MAIISKCEFINLCIQGYIYNYNVVTVLRYNKQLSATA